MTRQAGETPLTRSLQEEILTSGPISFRRFMEVALYDPSYGYYCQARDPFGTAGDFYTAEQIQPVFGILIAAQVRTLAEQLGQPPDFRVVELGAGRQEMRPFFSDFDYVPVDVGTGELPKQFCGVVFANEFFDALPVHSVVWSDGAARERLVGVDRGRFVWQEGQQAPAEVDDYLREHFPNREEGSVFEVNLEALRWIERISSSLTSGFVLTIDYGYTSEEAARFPSGSLMSYHRHIAQEDVLLRPGEQDITAHVCFTALERHANRNSLVTERFERLSSALVTIGEADQFAAALAASTVQEELRRRMQLKTLLFGMGDSFRVLLQRKVGTK